MEETLAEISELLKRPIDNPEAKLRIVVQTGYDEASLVATDDGFLRLAKALVDFVRASNKQKTEIWNIYGRNIPGDSSIHLLFGPDEVKIAAFQMAKSEDQVRQIAEDYYANSPSGSWVRHSDE